MLLAVDIGNSNIVLGLYEGNALTRTWRLTTDLQRTADEYGLLLEGLFARDGIALGAVESAAVANVVPPLQGVIDRVIHTACGVSPWHVSAGLAHTGVTFRTDYPAELGADRIANVAAAVHRHGGPVIVVDLGTATKFEAVSAQREYLGGVIAPGIQIAAEALSLRAARLPRVELAAPAGAIGRNTVQAMRAGLVFGYAGLVEGVVRRIQAELGGKARVVGTGGLIHTIARETNVLDEVDVNLTLHGLKLLYELNHSAEPKSAETLGRPRGKAAP